MNRRSSIILLRRKQFSTDRNRKRHENLFVSFLQKLKVTFNNKDKVGYDYLNSALLCSVRSWLFAFYSSRPASFCHVCKYTLGLFCSGRIEFRHPLASSICRVKSSDGDRCGENAARTIICRLKGVYITDLTAPSAKVDQFTTADSKSRRENVTLLKSDNR